MHTLIIYASHHGRTKECAEKIRKALSGGADLRHVKESGRIDLDKYDRILIGGSIHAGQIQKKVKQFCQKRESALANKQIGLFLCCMEEGENAVRQFENAFPEKLRRQAKATAILGGEFNFAKMNFLERAIIKKIAGTDENISRSCDEDIEKFVQKFC